MQNLRGVLSWRAVKFSTNASSEPNRTHAMAIRLGQRLSFLILSSGMEIHLIYKRCAGR